MARHITRIEDWESVNWDDVDFEHFDMESLRDASLDQIAEFRRRESDYQRDLKRKELEAFAEAHFKRALLEDRDPRSDRLFGEHQAIYQRLIDQHIPRTQPWDLTGIERWSDNDWAYFDWSSVRYIVIDPDQPNYRLFLDREWDSELRRHVAAAPKQRHIRRIADWDTVDWDEVDFDNFDFSSLDDDPDISIHFLPFMHQRERYESTWKAMEVSKRKWDDFDFSTIDWSKTGPAVLDIDAWDRKNHDRAWNAYEAWNAAEAKRPPPAPQPPPPTISTLAQQAGITLPDEF